MISDKYTEDLWHALMDHVWQTSYSLIKSKSTDTDWNPKYRFSFNHKVSTILGLVMQELWGTQTTSLLGVKKRWFSITMKRSETDTHPTVNFQLLLRLRDRPTLPMSLGRCASSVSSFEAFDHSHRTQCAGHQQTIGLFPGIGAAKSESQESRI